MEVLRDHRKGEGYTLGMDAGEMPIPTEKGDSKASRYNELSKIIRAIAEFVVNEHGREQHVYDFTIHQLLKAYRNIRARAQGATPVEEPEEVTRKGRPPKKRTMGAVRIEALVMEGAGANTSGWYLLRRRWCERRWCNVRKSVERGAME